MARTSSMLNLLLSIWIAILCSLSLSAPLESVENSDLIKRNSPLYTLWKSIPGAQIARGDSALAFDINQSEDNAWGITYLYGCTALMISDPEFVVVAHVQQVTASGTKCINDQAELGNWLAETLARKIVIYEATVDTQVDLIYNNNDCRWTGTGVQNIISFLTEDWGVLKDNISPRPYRGGSGTGEPNPDQPTGLAVIQWLKPQLEGLTVGTLQTFFNSDTPMRDQVFVKWENIIH